MNIVPVTEDTAALWTQLCTEFWPQNAVCEMLEAFRNGEYPHEYLAFETDACVGFVSLSVRHDYVEGKTDARPVGYLEGIYVRPAYRRQGIAKGLVAFARGWAAEQSCAMLASDCELANEDSRLFHNRVGFAEVGVNVHFAMTLS